MVTAPLDSDIRLEWPLWYHKILSPFGNRIHPITGENKFHNGVDIAVGYGEPVTAAAKGTVVKVELPVPGQDHGAEDTVYGNHLIIDHGIGTETLYAHCRDVVVKPGQEVKAGQLVAYVGSTGSSTGAHLHFGVRRNGEWVDPAIYLAED